MYAQQCKFTHKRLCDSHILTNFAHNANIIAAHLHFRVFTRVICAPLSDIHHHVSGAILFIWASVIDLYNRLKPGLTLSDISGEEGGSFTLIYDQG